MGDPNFRTASNPQRDQGEDGFSLRDRRYQPTRSVVRGHAREAHRINPDQNTSLTFGFFFALVASGRQKAKPIVR